MGYLLSFPKDLAVSLTPGADCLLLYSDNNNNLYILCTNFFSWPSLMIESNEASSSIIFFNISSNI